MSCLKPLLAIYDGENLKIINQQDISAEQLRLKYNDKLIELPCGKCIECKKAYAREKALRCALEAKEKTGNFFITLTYEHQPFEELEKLIPYATPEKQKELFKELQKFRLKTVIKDVKNFTDQLRKNNKDLSFLYCIELGERNNRIHAHFNGFGMEVPDAKIKNCRLKSDYLLKLWGQGEIDVMPFESGMAQYTAGYTAGATKKTLHISMSNNLGVNYILKNKYQILENNGNIFIENQKYKMGRWGYKALQKYGSIDIKPYRDKQAEQAAAATVQNLMKTGLTMDEYIEQRLQNRKNNKSLRKGGDGQ